MSGSVNAKRTTVVWVSGTVNVNPPFNEYLKSHSEVLWGYTCFVEKVRSYQRQGRKVEEAVETAIDECIREHILENFFLARKDELMNTDTLAPFAALESDPN